ncbi:hypothetical protein [Streptomyces sp. NPDC005476]|uniref:hypothetical protein n=1 Tax=Streptomyces sp. NPDC005476 TaxID=3156882 RepID=UPI0034553CB3
MTVHPLFPARPGRPPVSGATGTAVVAAVGFAVSATASAAVGYHLVFARTVSVTACLVAALVLFAGTLPRPFTPRSLLPDLGLMVLAQAAACCWFAYAAFAPMPARWTFHGGLEGAVHLAVTLLTVCALRDVTCSRTGLSHTVPETLRTCLHRLCLLLFTRTAVILTADTSRFCGARTHGDDKCASEALLTSATGRRGPP